MPPTPSSDSIPVVSLTTSTPVKDTAPKVVLRRKQESEYRTVPLVECSISSYEK